MLFITLKDEHICKTYLKENLHRCNKHLMNEYWKNFQKEQKSEKENTNG